jgi:hypothetical protein
MQVFRPVHAQPSLEANTLTRPARVFTDERMPPGPPRSARPGRAPPGPPATARPRPRAARRVAAAAHRRRSSLSPRRYRRRCRRAPPPRPPRLPLPPTPRPRCHATPTSRRRSAAAWNAAALPARSCRAPAPMPAAASGGQAVMPMPTNRAGRSFVGGDEAPRRHRAKEANGGADRGNSFAKMNPLAEMMLANGIEPAKRNRVKEQS